MAYLTPADFDLAADALRGYTLGVAGFQAARPARLAAGCPYVDTGMPALGGGPVYEVWTSASPVRHVAQGPIDAASADGVLFGCLQRTEAPGATLDDTMRAAYRDIFEFIAASGHFELLRVWNYVPGITRIDDGLERYRRASRGRHEAFVDARRAIERAPAASAIGTDAGPLTIYFLAAPVAGSPIENPRQLSAWRYPPQHGPRSPTFSRATWAAIAGASTLFVSGTASIVGHESLHRGDLSAQTQETIRNLRAVLDAARERGFDPDPDPDRAAPQLKVYLRHASAFNEVRAALQQAFGSRVDAVFLRADICRAELLIEIEGCWLAR